MLKDSDLEFIKGSKCKIPESIEILNKCISNCSESVRDQFSNNELIYLSMLNGINSIISSEAKFVHFSMYENWMVLAIFRLSYIDFIHDIGVICSNDGKWCYSDNYLDQNIANVFRVWSSSLHKTSMFDNNHYIKYDNNFINDTNKVLDSLWTVLFYKVYDYIKNFLNNPPKEFMDEHRLFIEKELKESIKNSINFCSFPEYIICNAIESLYLEMCIKGIHKS